MTHNSVELVWGASANAGEPCKESEEKLDDSKANRPCYTLQEKDHSGPNYATIYRGYSTKHYIIGLKPLNKYYYRLRHSGAQLGIWSKIITVRTSNAPPTCDKLHKAIHQGDINQVTSILKLNPEYVNIVNSISLSPLMIACAAGHSDIVRLLLTKCADADHQTSSGKTSLMESCYYGQVECAKLLVEYGSSWMARDNSGFSALHYAADGGNIDMVNFVLDANVPVDDVSDETMSGWTPLMRVAAVSGNGAVAQVLLARGAEVNRKDNDGNTPLMLASLNGFDDLVRVLLENDADPYIKSSHGRTSIDFATSFRRENVLGQLETALDINLEDEDDDEDYDYEN